MRASRWAAAAVALSAAGCGGESAELTVVLRAAEGTPVDEIGAFVVVVRDLGADTPEVFGPFAREDQVPLRSTLLPGARFYVDVWGCAGVRACEPIDVVARGCTAVREAEPGANSVAIELFESARPEARACPPAAE